jgi:hypothetical protein
METQPPGRDRSLPYLVPPVQHLLLLLFVLLSAHTQAQTRTITVQVEPYKALSYGAFYKSLVIKTDAPGAEHITGFQFTWGHRYTLKVRSHKLAHPPEDGSDTEYTLIAVVKDEPAPADLEFEMALQNNVYLGGEQASSFEVINDSTFRYFEEIDVEVPAALRPEFDQVLAGTDRRGRFVFVDERRIRLVGFSR